MSGTLSDIGPEELVEVVEELHNTLLSNVNEGAFSVEGEQYLLLAIGAVEQARRFAKLALYSSIRERRHMGSVE